MFKEGDYIVILSFKPHNTRCAKKNFIFKQRMNNSAIRPCVDLKGGTTNGNDCLRFDKSDILIDWRYATEKEIEFYDSQNKPCDATEIDSLAVELSKIKKEINENI